jgi:lysophospholipase L1-like esterase
VGDSVTAAAHCDCSGFVADYGVLLERRFDLTVDAVEYGVSGATTASMLPELSGSGGPARALARADVISVTIGANDLEQARTAYDDGTCGGARDLACFTGAVAAMKAGLARDLAAIDRLTAGRRVDVLVNNYWNVFEDGQVALDRDGQRYLDDSDTMTRMANLAICAAAETAGATCVDTYTPYKGEDGGKDPTELLASDGDHPNAAGHLVIAYAMLRAGLADLRS